MSDSDPVAAPRAGGAAEPEAIQREVTDAGGNVSWHHPASPVGATSAPASEPTTEAVPYVCRRCQWYGLARSLSDAQQAHWEANVACTQRAGYSSVEHATILDLTERLASQTSALAAAEQDAARLQWYVEMTYAHEQDQKRAAVWEAWLTAIGGIGGIATLESLRAAIDAARLAPPAGGTGGATA